MRCILVNDANLKADTYCTYCRKKIGDSYAREIGSRFIYCGYDCYGHASKAPAVVSDKRSMPAPSWTLSS
jgi:hypothetical protein